MKTPSTFVLIALVAGMVSGLVVAMTLLSLPKSHSAADPTVSSRPTGDAPAAGSEATPTTATPAPQPPLRSAPRLSVHQAPLHQHQIQLQHLEHRLQQLEETRNTRTDAAEEIQAQALPETELTPEEARAADLARWEELQRRFEHEEVDTQWAASITPLLAADIEGLGQASGFAMVLTECHSTQCTAVLEWPSYDEAVQGFGTLLHHAYQANCASGTLLPAPLAEEVEEPYLMTILFDCSAWRQQG